MDALLYLRSLKLGGCSGKDYRPARFFQFSARSIYLFYNLFQLYFLKFGFALQVRCERTQQAYI